MLGIVGSVLGLCPKWTWAQDASRSVPAVPQAPGTTSTLARHFTMGASEGDIVAIARIRSMAPLLPSSGDQWKWVRAILVLDYLEVFGGNVTGAMQVFTFQCAVCLAGELIAIGSSGSDPEWLQEGDVILFRAGRDTPLGDGDFWAVYRVRIVDGYGTPEARLLTTRRGTINDARIDCSGIKSAVVNGKVDRKTTDVGSLAEVIEAIAPAQHPGSRDDDVPKLKRPMGNSQ